MKPLQLPILKKAYEVKDPTIYERDNDDINWELVYADSGAQAKHLCSDYAHFVSIKVRRNEAMDEVLFEDRQVTRHSAEHILAERKRKQLRTDKVMRYGEKEMFYVQNGYVGNCVTFWGKGSSGYVTDIEKAEKYTRQQILDSFTGGREEDTIWLAREVEKKIKQTVDAQYLDYKFMM